MKDVLIIGAGPAGLSASIYAARAGLSVLVFDKSMYGGQMALAGEIANYPSRHNISGADIAIDMYTHATSLGVELRFEEVTSVELTANPKTLTTPAGVYQGRTVIIASGASRRRLGCPGEERLIGQGISFCATCDAAFYSGKTAAVVGGGNTALEDALFLANHCETVYLIHRRDTFRGEKMLQDAVLARENIKILYSTTIQSVEGEAKIEALQLQTPQGIQRLRVDGLFVAIGLVPQSALFVPQLTPDANGYFPVAEDCTTPIPGVFVAGDLRAKPLRQIITAASDGAVAAVAAATSCSVMENSSCKL